MIDVIAQLIAPVLMASQVQISSKLVRKPVEHNMGCGIPETKPKRKEKPVLTEKEKKAIKLVWSRGTVHMQEPTNILRVEFNA